MNMKKLFAILAIAFLSSCSTEGRYQMLASDDGYSVWVLDTKTGEVYYRYQKVWIEWGSPKDDAKPL